MRIVMLGAPGAGKGTQADIIHSKMGLTHIASGNLFRQALDKNTELGILAKSYMEKGTLVPDGIVIKMILQRISKPDCSTGWILEGFPRTLEQAEALDQVLVEKRKGVDKAIYVEVPEEELVKRLSGRWICNKCQTPYHILTSPPDVAGKCDKCGGELYQRLDDNEQTVRERLNVFNEMTIPILDYYREQDKLVTVNGNQGIQVVAELILSELTW
jgi:adenylate kinase